MTKPDLQEANDEEVEAFHCLFPYKLHRTLSLCEQQGLCHIVSWLECGTAFRVHNIKDFEVYVLPQLGRLSRYKSFLRQLHLYKFTPVLSSKSDGGLFSSKKGGGARAYQHAYFRRDHISLCRGVLRGKVLRSPNSRPGAVVPPHKEELFNRTAAYWEDTAGTTYTDTRNIFTPTPAPSSSGDCSSTRVASCCHLVGKNTKNGNEDSATELVSVLPPVVVASLSSSHLLIEHQEQHKLLGNPKAEQNSRSAGRVPMRASLLRKRQDASSMLMPSSPSPDFASCSDIGGESTILDPSFGPAVASVASGLLFLENLHGNTHSLDIEDEIINTFTGPVLATPY